jgi:hypothetical protein
MLEISILQKILIISTMLSAITCTFVQKTKRYFKSSTMLMLYSMLVNLLFAVFFCITFTSINFSDSLWVGLFSFLGADTIYKTLEGKIASFRDLK